MALAKVTQLLDVALKDLGVGQGDKVVVTPRTFIASISCVVSVGAVPVFADVEADSGNVSARTFSAVLSPATRAVVCVHLAGWPCDMDPIMALAAERGLPVIEYCAQAHGARYKGRHFGSIGHVGAYSFCQDKIETTGGEGEMVTRNDEALWRTMWSFEDHGKSSEAVYKRQHAPGFRWLHESFGTNWCMLEMQAVLGRIQLRRMSDWSAARARNTQAILPACAAGVVRFMPRWLCSGRRGLRARALQVLCLRATRVPSTGLDPEPDHRGVHRRRCALLPGIMLRGVFGEGLRRHRLAACGAAARGARLGRDIGDVFGAPHTDIGRSEQDLRGCVPGDAGGKRLGLTDLGTAYKKQEDLTP